MCADIGFSDVRTYIASGNVVFTSGRSAATVGRSLEQRLETYAGKPVGVVIRDAAGMCRVLEHNPFAGREPGRTIAIFLDGKPPADAIEQARGVADEEMAVGGREIYVYYPAGMARSKLRIPAAAAGTGRNMNTVARLVEMVSES